MVNWLTSSDTLNIGWLHQCTNLIMLICSSQVPTFILISCFFTHPVNLLTFKSHVSPSSSGMNHIDLVYLHFLCTFTLKCTGQWNNFCTLLSALDYFLYIGIDTITVRSLSGSQSWPLHKTVFISNSRVIVDHYRLPFCCFLTHKSTFLFLCRRTLYPITSYFSDLKSFSVHQNCAHNTHLPFPE